MFNKLIIKAEKKLKIAFSKNRKLKKVNRAIWGVIFNSCRDNFLEIVVFEQTPVVGENIHGIKINSRCKCPYLG